MKKQLLFYIIVLITTVSCKKDDNKINPIFDRWTFISGGENYENAFQNLKYIIIRPDNTVSLLYEHSNGIRSCEEGLCQVVNTQINLFGYYLFNFTIINNNLILSNPDGKIIYERHGDEPLKREWIKPLQVLETMNAPIQARSDLAFDGNFIWYGGFRGYSEPARLYKINPSTLSIVSNLTITNWPIGVEWADGHIWTSSNGYSSIFKVDPATGSNLFTSVSMGSWISGIAFDDQYFWCGANLSIYKYNPGLNTVEDTYQIGCQLDGMAYIQDHLYICANGVLNKCTVDPLQFVDAYELGMGYIHGVAYDGNDFWISASINNETPSFKVCKVSW